jgi:ABC-type Fe3+-hydroxamate transport system substrate-binding protein
VPSITETLFDLGLGPWVVARTGFCIHPAAGVAAVPKVGGTKDVNMTRLRRLAPTHVIVNVDENRLSTVEALREFVPQIIVTHPRAPANNLLLIDRLSAAFAAVAGVAEQAARWRGALAAELALTRPHAFAPAAVLYLIWRGPWMTVARDTYISAMLAQVNWQTLPPVEGGDQGAARYPALQGNEAWLRQVQRVLLSSEPYAFTAAHCAEAQALCPQAAVQLVDGEAVSWYGTRAVAGLRYLRGLAGAR